MLISLPDALIMTRKRLKRSQSSVAKDLGLSRYTICDFERGQPARHGTERMIRIWLLTNGVKEHSQ